MKRNTLLSFALTIAFLPLVIATQAQQSKKNKPVQQEKLDRSIRPKPGTAPQINIGKYESFTLDNGLKVFVVTNNKIPRVSYSLIIDYTPVNAGPDAGLSDITGDILRTGTKKYTKDQLDEEIDFIGASIYTNSTGLYASGLTKNKEKLLDLMSEILLNPVFDTAELAKIRTRYLSSLEAARTEPSAISERINSILLFGENHPYGEIETEESINNINAEKCKAFYETYFRPQLAYLAVVGDITFEEVKSDIQKYFSTWQKNDLSKKELSFPNQPESKVIAIVDRPEAVQTNLTVSYPVNLKPGTPDVVKAVVTNTILGGGTFRLYKNLRETNAFTYGAYSRLSSDQYAGKFEASTEIRNSVTDSALIEILNEMKRLREEVVPQDELSLAKNYIAGNFALSLENPQTVANFAINTARYDLPADYYPNYLKNLAAVNADDVKAMATKYILPENNYIVAVGKASEITPKLQPFGRNNQIRFYDFNGEQYDPNKKIKEAPAGLTAEAINSSYIAAIGGEKELSKIKDITLNATTSMQGMTIGFDIYRKAPNKYMMKVGAGEMVFQQIVFDGENALMVSPMSGENKKLEGPELEDMKFEAQLNPELKYEELGIKLNLEGIEQVGQIEAYKITLTKPSGKTSIRYFDTKSNLLIKEISDQGTIEYSDYREVGKLKFPYKMAQSGGGQSIDLNVISVKINSKLSDDLFTIK